MFYLQETINLQNCNWAYFLLGSEKVFIALSIDPKTSSLLHFVKWRHMNSLKQMLTHGTTLSLFHHVKK